MTMLHKLLFRRKKPEPKIPDAFEEIRAQAPPYLVDKNYIYDDPKAGVLALLDLVIAKYNGEK